jgi:subtilase family serine protease
MMALGVFTLAASATETGKTGPLPEFKKVTPTASDGTNFRPENSKPQAKGFAHTTYVLRSLDGKKPAPNAFLNHEADVVNPDASVQIAQTPCSLGYIYVASPLPQCSASFNITGGPSAGGTGVIVLVDAYDNPDAASDLTGFIAQFKLPQANFTKVYANGNGDCTTPPPDAGWALEESLDIEWAHVFAPSAAIVLVEACSNSFADLIYAEQVAFQYIVSNYPTTGGTVSNSWIGGEGGPSGGDIANDSYFADFDYNSATDYETHILAFAAAGDSGGEIGWPSTDPWVISAGGTSLYDHSATSTYYQEGCWSGSGGGFSAVENYVYDFTGGNIGPWANYQYPIFGPDNTSSAATTFRSVPDAASDADPNSGVYVLAQYNGGWYIVGGTSVASPSLASIVNRSSNHISSVDLNAITGGNAFFAAAEHNYIYAQLQGEKEYPRNWEPITTGTNGYTAYYGYNQCTGVGAPRGYDGK